MRIIGIDPGTAIVGYGIIDYENGENKLIASGSIQTSKDKDDADRLLEIKKDLSTILNQYQPEAASVEKLFFFKNQKTIVPVAQGRGVILAVLKEFGIKIFEYTPLQIKQAITGYGHANKKDVAEMVERMIICDYFPKLDDTADAIAIAVCHIRTGEVCLAQH